MTQYVFGSFCVGGCIGAKIEMTVIMASKKVLIYQEFWASSSLLENSGFSTLFVSVFSFSFFSYICANSVKVLPCVSGIKRPPTRHINAQKAALIQNITSKPRLLTNEGKTFTVANDIRYLYQWDYSKCPINFSN